MNFSNIYSKYTDSVIGTVLANFDSTTLSLYHKWMNNNGTNSSYTNANKRAVASMLDTVLWKGYCNTQYASYSIGGPTLEMLITSYNEKFNTTITINENNNYGYGVGSSNSDATTLHNDINEMYSKGYWIASPNKNSQRKIIL